MRYYELYPPTKTELTIENGIDDKLEEFISSMPKLDLTFKIEIYLSTQRREILETTAFVQLGAA